MKLYAPVLNLFSALWRWLRVTRHVSAAAFLLALLVFGVCVMQGDLANFSAVQMLSHMGLFALLGGGVYFIVIIRAYPDVRKMMLPTWVVSIYLTCWVVAGSLYERWQNARIETIGEEFSKTAYIIHLVLLVGIFFSPLLALYYFQRCRIMERYVLKRFLHPMAFCFLGFGSLWVVMDLKDNLAQFQENKIPMGQVLLFYFRLLPFIYVYVAPVTLLLATLYSLGKMSRSNELISMLGMGKSMGQVLRPIFIIAAYASFIGMAANYQWAPQAEGNKKSLLQMDREKLKGGIMTQGLVYRNNENRRTWFIGTVPYNLRDEKLRRVEVRQEDESGNLTKAWMAKSAFWWPDKRLWSFYNGVEVTYENGTIASIIPFEKLNGSTQMNLEGWSETPWILLSGSVTPEFLGVPALTSYITANKAYDQRKLAPFRTHLFYRFAVPMQCLVIVLIAAPLGVVFSRRGMLGGVASSVFIFFILMFIDSLFLNLGKGSRMAPWLAPWMPHVILGSVGGVLFYFRSHNRDFPKLSSLGELADAAKFLWAGVRGVFTPSV